MNLQTKMPTTADEFLRWNEGREGKREFVRGRVVEMMVGVSKHHFAVVGRLLYQLMRQLGLKEYAIGSAEFGVRTDEGVRYPDVLVDRLIGAGSELAAKEPLLIAEVLSRSSYSRDFGEKVSDYATVPSLLYYVILSQDEPRLWLWSRALDGGWSGPSLIAGQGETVELSRLEIFIDVGEIYDGLFDADSAN
jgi:Uma2 family endonuclease